MSRAPERRSPVATVRRQAREHSGALFAFLARGWASGAGLVLVLLATTRLTPAEQGYFFTFQTLLFFQFFLELGFAVVLTQFVSHEWAHLHLEGGGVEGDPMARARLAGMVQLARRWYARASAGFLIVAAPAGALFFAERGEGGVEWLAPWLALCVAQALAILYSPLPALLEGTGDVSRSQRSLLTANIAAGVAAWAALILGAGLWAAAIQVAVRASFALVLLLPATRAIRAPLPAGAPRVDDREWRPAFTHQQLRIAASWGAGLVMFHSFTPIAFALQGAVVAGQVGVMMQAFHGVNQLASAWLTAAQPRMGHLGSLRRFEELRGLMRTTLVRCTATATMLAAGIFGAIVLLHWWRPEQAERFGGPGMAAAFLAAAVLLQVSNVWTAAIRFQKLEPFVALAWIGAMLITGLCVLLGLMVGGIGFGLALLAGAILLSVGGKVIGDRELTRIAGQQRWA